MRAPILIHGPTASGKTALSLALAARCNGEIVNADSMQVYRDMNVLTARPSEAEMDGVPHHLFGHIDPSIRYSAGRWIAEVSPVLKDIEARGKTAIIVGGTGLYFLALLKGLSQIPPVPEDVRAEVRALLAEEGPSALHARLKKVDPVSGKRLEPSDRQRVSRAYEVWLATGKPLSDFHNDRLAPPLDAGAALTIALTPPRARLYSRIDRRFEGMLMAGAMIEARQLVQRGLDAELPAMKAHGMPWLAAFIRNEISAELAAENAKRDTRRYAKRQFTWISNQFPFWPRIPVENLEHRIRIILALHREIDAA